MEHAVLLCIYVVDMAVCINRKHTEKYVRKLLYKFRVFVSIVPVYVPLDYWLCLTSLGIVCFLLVLDCMLVDESS